MFQSGISLSICLHDVYKILMMYFIWFQSGISLSICLHIFRWGKSSESWPFVSIRHQPEYLPSPDSVRVHNRIQGSEFQSGISLSICLHVVHRWSEEKDHMGEFQSGISLSICLHGGFGLLADEQFVRVSIRHQPEYLPSHHALRYPRVLLRGFQSGISLSICLHSLGVYEGRKIVPFQSGISLSICLHGSAELMILEAMDVSIRHQPEYLPSRCRPGRRSHHGGWRFNQASA